MPARRASSTPAPGQRRPARRRRGPGGGDRDVDAAGVVGPPGHAGRELVAPVAGEDEVGVAVDEARAGRSARRRRCAGRRRRPRRPTATMRSPSTTTHAFVTDAERPVAELGVVGDEQADVVDDERGRVTTCAPRPTPTPSAPARRRRRAGRGDRRRTTTSPPTTTWCTSAAVAANTTASSASAGSVPARRTDAEVDGHQVGRGPGRQASRPPASRCWRGRRRWPPGAGRRAGGGPARRSCEPLVAARRPGPPRTGRSPRASRCRASAGLRRRRSRRAGPMPSARSRSVVGQQHTEQRCRAERRRCRRR